MEIPKIELNGITIFCAKQQSDLGTIATIIHALLNQNAGNKEIPLVINFPETGLHPLAQLESAKNIVESQVKNNAVKVVIVTNSPIILRTIEVYTDLHKWMNNLDVYLVDNESTKNVSYSEYGVSELYELMSTPYGILDNILEDTYGPDYD